MNTKFFNIIKNFQIANQKKFYFFSKRFSFSLFCLFLGFVCGNLFGTFLNFFRHFTNWDGTIILFTILFIEFINYFNYTNRFQTPKEPISLTANFQTIKHVNKQIIFILNFYKIGLLLGFFTDAFKVGS